MIKIVFRILIVFVFSFMLFACKGKPSQIAEQGKQNQRECQVLPANLNPDDDGGGDDELPQDDGDLMLGPDIDLVQLAARLATCVFIDQTRFPLVRAFNHLDALEEEDDPLLEDFTFYRDTQGMYLYKANVGHDREGVHYRGVCYVSHDLQSAAPVTCISEGGNDCDPDDVALNPDASWF